MANESMSREGLIWKVMTVIAEAEGKDLGGTGNTPTVDRRYMLVLLNAVDEVLRQPHK